MATIIDFGARWTLTEKAADIMVQADVLYKCNVNVHVDIIPADEPIYHASSKAPPEFGYTTIHTFINLAEMIVEN